MQFEPQEQQRNTINADPREQQHIYDQPEYYGIPGADQRDDEKLHPGPTQRRPAKKRFPLFLIVVLLLAALALGGAFTQVARSNFPQKYGFPHTSYSFPQGNVGSHTFNVTGQNTLVVNDNSGAINIQSGPANSIVVQPDNNSFFNSHNNNSNPITYSQQGNTVSVSAQSGPQFFSMQDTGVNITVPDGTILQINGDSGDVHISNFNGQVSTTTSSGDISIDHSQLQGRTNIQTDSGDISMNGSFDPNGNYQFQTQSGDVDLQVPSNSSLQLSTSTDSGDINNDFNHNTIGNNPHAPLFIRTDSGDIHIGISGGN